MSWDKFLNFVLEFSKLCIPSVFAYLMYRRGISDNRKINKQDVLIERVNSFYRPVFKDLYKSKWIVQKSVFALTEYNVDKALEIVELCMQNIHYADPQSQKIIISTYKSMNSKSFSFPGMVKGAREISEFELMIKSLFEEYTEICNTLELPIPVDVF